MGKTYQKQDLWSGQIFAGIHDTMVNIVHLEDQITHYNDAKAERIELLYFLDMHILYKNIEIYFFVKHQGLLHYT